MTKILELQGITKEFPGVKALDSVDFNVYRGRVMGLLGENGAGKSTLMKILCGAYTPDRGSIQVAGETVSFQGVSAAKKYGISIIHQELSLFPELSIAENIFLDKLPTNIMGKVRWQQVHRETEKLLDMVCVRRTPQEIVKNLSISEKQLVEVGKSLAEESKIVIMDEPTDSLTDKEVENLFAIIQRLKESDKSIIYITHRLSEIFQVCNDVTILRDGRFVCEAPSAQLNEQSLIAAMVGRELKEQFPNVPTTTKEQLLELKNVSNEKITDINITIYSGEILGILGLMGAGRTELAKTIYGYYPVNSGKILYKGREISLKSPASGVKNRILYVSEDRKTDGLIVNLSVKENMVLSALRKFEDKFKKLQRKKEELEVEQYIAEFNIKTPNIQQKVAMLSGGNQQKISIAKALMSEPQVLILDEPTRGIDVGAKKEIYDLINRLKLQGLAIVLISSEMPEVLGLSDRIAVMCNKRITGVFSASESNQEQLLKYATDF